MDEVESGENGGGGREEKMARKMNMATLVGTEGEGQPNHRLYDMGALLNCATSHNGRRSRHGLRTCEKGIVFSQISNFCTHEH